MRTPNRPSGGRALPFKPLLKRGRVAEEALGGVGLDNIDVQAARGWLETQGVAVEALRVDEYTGRRFCFFADPDGLPLELYEAPSP